MWTDLSHERSYPLWFCQRLERIFQWQHQTSFRALQTSKEWRFRRSPLNPGPGSLANFELLVMNQLAIFKKSYKSAMGMPTAAVFDEFLKVHPNAKVILTVRDSPEEWAKSFQETVMKMYHLPYWYVWVNQLCGGPIGHISKCKQRNTGELWVQLCHSCYTIPWRVLNFCFSLSVNV